MQRFRAQGATEYLVLLAVVLIIALVAVALLGFFPGTATDAQATESRIYWQSQSPIAITDGQARLHAGNGETYGYLRFRNNAAYPVRITGLLDPNGNKLGTFWSCGSCAGRGGCGDWSLGDYLYLGAGEEQGLGAALAGATGCAIDIAFSTGSGGGFTLGGATSVCQNSNSSPGRMEMKSFGIEYVAYLEGQQVTKREIGTKPLILRCREPYYP